jgi:hypothetical protein
MTSGDQWVPRGTHLNWEYSNGTYPAYTKGQEPFTTIPNHRSSRPQIKPPHDTSDRMEQDDPLNGLNHLLDAAMSSPPSSEASPKSTDAVYRNTDDSARPPISFPNFPHDIFCQASAGAANSVSSFVTPQVEQPVPQRGEAASVGGDGFPPEEVVNMLYGHYFTRLIGQTGFVF